MRVVVGMIHDLVPGIGEGLDRFGVFVDPRADDEKGGLDIVFGEDVNEHLCVLVPQAASKVRLTALLSRLTQ